LLNVCGDKVQRGIPAKTFFAKDLDPRLAKRVQEICNKTDVKEGPLLDACMIDVAFTGKTSAAKIHAKTWAPQAVGQFN